MSVYCMTHGNRGASSRADGPVVEEKGEGLWDRQLSLDPLGQEMKLVEGMCNSIRSGG